MANNHFTGIDEGTLGQLGITNFGGFDGLTSLSMRGNGLTGVNAIVWTALAGLTTLDLGANRFVKDVLNGFVKCHFNVF